jgi:hypothetical protein
MKKQLLLLATIAMFIVIGCKKDDAAVTPPATDVSVTSVAPIQGNEGTVITITGTNFGTDKSALKVEFGTAVATIDTIIGGTQIKTKVPAAAVEGAIKINVTKASVVGSADFTVLAKIVGNWVSQGTNVPYGLRVAPFKVVKIVATFNSNNSYNVLQTDSAGVQTTFTGTYSTSSSAFSDTASSSTTKGSTIINIVANQATPSSVTSTGIYAISSSNMTYEIIQTTPAISGVSAPTAAGGFGSTTIAGVKYAIYVQKYVKQ